MADLLSSFLLDKCDYTDSESMPSQAFHLVDPDWVTTRLSAVFDWATVRLLATSDRATVRSSAAPERATLSLSAAPEWESTRLSAALIGSLQDHRQFPSGPL